MEVKFGNQIFYLTNDELELIKSNTHPQKISVKTVEAIDVAVYVGKLLIGYINIELGKRLLKELKKI